MPTKAKYDLLGIGKINIDVVSSPDGVAKYVGGHVPNIVSCASLLGLRTALIARVGKDKEGGQCLSELKRRGVDTSYIEVDDSPTPVLKVRLTPDGDRILEALPAKLTEYNSAKHISAVQKSRAVFLGNATIGFGSCAEDCAKAGVTLISSLQSVTDMQSERAKALAAHPPHVLFGNEEEVSVAEKIVDAVLTNDGLVIVTLGKKGCAVLTGDEKNTYKGFEARVVDATGAGDTFTAAFIFGILNKYGERTASFANAAGAIAVSENGPVPKLTLERVEKFLAEAKQDQK